MKTSVAIALFCSVLACGAVKRSSAAKHAFIAQSACPSTGLNSFYYHLPGQKPKYIGCPGFVIDHVNPLCAGGADAPANMQWQAVKAAAAKDVIEKHQCAAYRNQHKPVSIK